jgi:hypothetical protein
LATSLKCFFDAGALPPAVAEDPQRAPVFPAHWPDHSRKIVGGGSRASDRDELDQARTLIKDD